MMNLIRSGLLRIEMKRKLNFIIDFVSLNANELVIYNEVECPLFILEE
jgi:hypothetical protein